MTNKQMRWYGVMTLFVIVAVSYIDRINVSILITDHAFLEHFGMAPTDRFSQGMLATAFMIGYGVSAFVLTPFAAALFGVRRSLIYGLTLWGVVTFFSPALSSYGFLLASRILLGVSEGPLFSLASAYIKAHFTSQENGKPNSIVNMGTGLGLAIGYPFVGYLVSSYDWITSFHVLGLLNILLGIPLVLAFVKMPQSATAQIKPKSMKEAFDRVGAIVRGALHTRHLVLITVLTAAYLGYLWGSSNWLPAYLKEARGFSIREMGWLASLPQYATVIAVFIGGVIIDRMSSRNLPMIFVVCSAGVGIMVWLAIYSADRYWAAYSLIGANFFWGLMSPAIPTMVQNYARPEHVASAFGVVNGTGSLVAGFMPSIMGAVITAVTAGSGSAGAGAGFFAGFGVLIATQVVVLICGLILWFQERASPTRIEEVAEGSLAESSRA